MARATRMIRTLSGSLLVGTVVLALANSASAAMFDLTQTYTTTPTGGVIVDSNGNAVTVDVNDLGGNQSPMGGLSDQSAFDPDAGGDSLYFGMGGNSGSSNGELIYTFTAPAGETFAGSFGVRVQMAAAKRFNSTNGVVKIGVKFDALDDFTTLAERDAPDTGGDLVFNKFDDTLNINAVGHEQVFVRLFTGAGFFSSTAQLAYARFTGQTVVPEPASLALLGLGGLIMLSRKRRRGRVRPRAQND